jgi:hypothetical protein
VPEGKDPTWPAQCRNCEANLSGPYCSACGESHVHGRLELRALVEHAFDGLINLDTRALRTFGELTVNPGKVCRDYLDGRRVLYVNPFKYALATFTFAVLVDEGLLYLHGPSDPSNATLIEFELRWGLLINFLAMPLLAACLWPLFFSAPNRLRWVEHYVVVLFTIGHVALLQGLLQPLAAQLGNIGSVAFTLLTIVFLSWAAIHVHGSRWWSTIPRVLLAFAAMWMVVWGVIRLLVPDLPSPD